MSRAMPLLALLLWLWVCTAFGQEEPAKPPAPLLTLDQAVAKALAANPSIKASEQSVAAADAKADSASMGFLPQLLLSLSYRRATLNQALSPPMEEAFSRAASAGTGGTGGSSATAGISSAFSRTEMTSYNNYSAGVTLNHPIWDFGRTSGGWDAAKESSAAARSDVITSKDQVRLNTILAYYSVLGAEEAVSVSEETVSQMEKHLAFARAQAEAGVRQRIDVTRAESDLASARLTLSKARNGELLARVQLANAMGLGDSPEFRVERPPAGKDLDTRNMEALVKAALKNRPDVRALEARVRASERLVSVAKSGYYPTLGASAGVNWQGYHLKFTDNNLPYNWFVGVNATWNALSPLSSSAASREAEANLAVLRANLDNMELGIRAEVKSAILALREAKERMQPVEALLASAAETLRLAEGRYQAGSGGIIEMTDAEAVYTQARLSKIQAEYDVETAQARLQKALGAFDGREREP